MEDLCIHAQGLIKNYGGKKVVDGFHLAVPRGAIYGLLGPNGAGKTTSIRMTLGIIDPDEGQSLLFGNSSPAAVRYRIGYLPEERGLYANMTAKDTIGFLGALRGLPWKEGRKRAIALMDDVGLSHALDQKISKMSKGMAQMVQLLGAIVHQPDLIVLDEPFSGLDPMNQGLLESIVLRERDRGATILFSTHVMAHAERLCDEISIIARSKMHFHGKIDEARALLPMKVDYRPRHPIPSLENADFLPSDAQKRGDSWHFSVADGSVEPLLSQLIQSPYGVAGLSIDHPNLHEAFVHIIEQADADHLATEEYPA